MQDARRLGAANATRSEAATVHGPDSRLMQDTAPVVRALGGGIDLGLGAYPRRVCMDVGHVVSADEGQYEVTTALRHLFRRQPQCAETTPSIRSITTGRVPVDVPLPESPAIEVRRDKFPPCPHLCRWLVASP